MRNEINLKKMYREKKTKVLIALDYNATAQHIAEAGFALAKAMNGEVILLHVVARPVYDKTTRYFPELRFTPLMETSHPQSNNIDRPKKASLGFMDKIKASFGEIPIHIRVEEGDLAETILRTAHDIFADFLVMGSRSKRRTGKGVMGSVTERVLMQTTIPLIFIPAKASENMEVDTGKIKGIKNSLIKERFKENYQ